MSPYLRILGVTCLSIYAFCSIWFGGVGKIMQVGFISMTLLLMLTSHRRMALDIYFKLVLLAVLVQLIPWCLGRMILVVMMFAIFFFGLGTFFVIWFRPFVIIFFYIGFRMILFVFGFGTFFVVFFTVGFRSFVIVFFVVFLVVVFYLFVIIFFFCITILCKRML